MSENTVRIEESRPSRLGMVKSGAVNSTQLKMPRRGKAMLDLDTVIPDPRNERKTFRGIEELAASINQVGIVEPPTVVPLEDGRYMITTGERRWRAAKKAGLKQITVIIGDPEEEKTRRVKSLVSNVQREDLSALELAHALQEMKDENGDIKTNRNLVTLVGKTEQWVGQMLKLLSLPEDIQKDIQGADRIVPYESVLQIARTEGEEARRGLLKEVLSGATVRETREQARILKAQTKRAGKGTTKSTQKIATSKGWVIVYCQKQNPKKEDYVLALTEALKAARANGN